MDNRKTMLRQAGLVFLLALLAYGALFSVDMHLRARKGPWSLTFSQNAMGEACVRIDQPALGITNVTLVIQAEIYTQPTKTVHFGSTGADIPFGEVVFFDTTYLPGTVTMNLGAHGVEIFPRAFVVDRKEHAWKSNLELRLLPSDRVPAVPPASKSGTSFGRKEK